VTDRERGPSGRRRWPDRFRLVVSRLLGAAQRTELPTVIALVAAPVLAVFGDVIAGQLPLWVRYVLTGLVPTLIVLVVLVQLFDRRRALPLESGRLPLEPGLPLRPWSPEKLSLLGRTVEMERAGRLAAAGGVIGIVGPRDVGTSSAASQLVRDLPASPDPDNGQAGRYRLDLRGPLTGKPEQTRVVAVQLLAGFGLRPPADGSAEELRAAAHRLQYALRDRSVVLLLDEAFKPEQVRWLVEHVSQGGPLTVVVAGEQAVAGAFADDRLVRIGPLDEESAVRLFRDRLGSSPPGSPPPKSPWLWPKRLRLRARREPPDRRDVLTVVRGCLYLPGVIVDVADELRREGSVWTLAELAAALRRVRDAEPPDPDSPAVWVWTQFLLPRMLHSLSRDAQELMAALAGLNVTELPSSALAELPPGGGGDALRELRSRYLVRFVPPDRYRMPEEVRRAVRYGVPANRVTQAAAAATGRLVAHYAELAESKADQLRSPATAAEATAWFTAEERILAALLAGAARLAETKGLELEGIASALDAWYVRTGDAVGLAELAQTTRPVAERLGKPDLVALAGLRRATAHRMAGEFVDAERELATVDDLLSPLGSRTRSGPRWRSGSPAWRSWRPESAAWRSVEARCHNGWALLRLAQLPAGAEPSAELSAGLSTELDAVAKERLLEAEQSLQRCQQLLPQADKVGEVNVKVNLGAVQLALGYPAKARMHLTRAVALAAAAGDWSGRAHAIELLGIAAWQTGERAEAHVQWQAAALAFDELGETVAAARCRGHRAARAG
jgi:hypothetical protein